MLSLLFLLLQVTLPIDHSVSKSGMTVEWTYLDKNHVKFNVSSPSSGWVAIGLNTEERLVGSNLIMTAASPNGGIISDRFIVGFGNHQAVEDLGAKSQVELLSAQNSNGGTTVEFILTTVAQDAYHFNLDKGETYYLTLAYSHDNDFMHHSAMRTSLEITF